MPPVTKSCESIQLSLKAFLGGGYKGNIVCKKEDGNQDLVKKTTICILDMLPEEGLKLISIDPK